ncbi:ATP-binding cassette domain-containing protein [Evansella tamaricis]|uniref:ABC transporter ATP-binding protein n=1 Tax=Evansella tamaricis TaxID=2069301 RepID=A0ABS6J9V2_9BACI|nr:ABC transporter ATP-binding protein [Evansella tamaricis]MBU9710461.1 ABC transporter ATP-binding protein [Evansella tamaricis]
MNIITFNHVTKEYKNKKAIDNLSFSIEENKITGIIGRNGAGKTTLLKIIAGFFEQSQGEVKVFDETPFNSITVSANCIFIDDQLSFPSTLNLGEILDATGKFYENWDTKLANGLFDYFNLDRHQSHEHLSKGMKSTFNVIIGLASRCPLTLFDEPTTGMDAAVRKDVYRALLKDYITKPRTILISSHHLQEIEDLLEDILLIKDGKAHLHLPVSDMKEYAIGIKGKASVLEKWLENRDILHKSNLGTDSLYVVVRNNFSTTELEKARVSGLILSQVNSSELSVYLTSKTKGGIDDVFSETYNW